MIRDNGSGAMTPPNLGGADGGEITPPGVKRPAEVISLVGGYTGDSIPKMIRILTVNSAVTRSNCRSQLALFVRPFALGKQAVGHAGIALFGLMQLFVVALAKRGVGFTVQEGEEGVASSVCHRRHLMQCAAGKYRGAPMRRPINAAAEFREDQIAAVIVLIEIDRHGKAAMLRPGIDVVAMPVKVAAGGAVVTGYNVAIHPRRPELEEAFEGRQQAANDLIANEVAQFRGDKVQVVAAFEPVVDHSRRLAFGIEEESGILAAELVVKLH